MMSSFWPKRLFLALVCLVALCFILQTAYAAAYGSSSYTTSTTGGDRQWWFYYQWWESTWALPPFGPGCRAYVHNPGITCGCAPKNGTAWVCYLVFVTNDPTYHKPPGMATADNEWCTDNGSPPGSQTTTTYTCSRVIGATYSNCGQYSVHKKTAIDAVWQTIAVDGPSSCYNLVDYQVNCNNVPTAPAVTLTPTQTETSPNTNEDLVCTITSPSTDADSDAITYTYNWYKNGVLQSGLTVSGTTSLSKTASNTYTVHNEVWGCVVTANDNQGGATSGTSNSLTVRNSAPSAPVVQLTPAQTATAPKTDADLVCAIKTSSTDGDGDTLTYKYEWLVNGDVNSSLTVASTSASSNTVLNTRTLYNQSWICRVTASDGFGGNSTPGVSFSVVIRNTAPSAPDVDKLDRVESSTKLRLTLKDSVDPDVVEGAQTLSYFGRMWDKDNVPTNPAPLCAASAPLNGFASADGGTTKQFTVPLLAENVYFGDGRAFDGVEYSGCSGASVGGMETPFQPNCSNLNMKAELASVSCNNPLGKTMVAFSVSCDRDSQMDEDWKILVNGIDFESGAGSSIGGGLVNQLGDCNSSKQVVFSIMDTNLVGSYLYRLKYGGTFNSQEVVCPLAGAFIVDEDNCNSNGMGGGGGGTLPCQKYGFGVVMTGALPRSNNKMDFNFSYVCADVPTILSSVSFYNSSGNVIGASKQFSPALMCSSSTGNFSATMDSNAFGTYLAAFDYAGGCAGNMAFSINSGGFYVGEAPEVLQIPDSNPLVACLVLLAAAALIARRRK